MGTVYAARDTESGRELALKVLSSELDRDEEKFRRFEQEVTALARVDHPNIVRLLGPLERDGPRTFFTMELLQGTTLSSLLRRRGPLPVPEALRIFRCLLGALAAAHGAGVVHRDIKPSNILLVSGTVKITDFGLARMEDLTRLTRTGQLMGTLDYMSPEQCEGAPIDHRSDLYSAGIVLYEMLVGEPPFRNASPGAVLRGHLEETPPRVDRIRADLPEGLAEVVERLLAKDPGDRPPDAEAVLRDLDRIRDPARTVTFHDGVRPRSAAEERARPPRRRRPSRRVILASLAGLLLVGAGIAILVNRSRPRYPGQATPGDLLVTLHRAIENRDFRTFARCFDPLCLEEFFPEDPARLFLERREGIRDFAFRSGPPRRPPPIPGITLRVVSGPALPAVLGLPADAPLRLALRPEGGRFRVERVFAGTAGVVPKLLEFRDLLKRMLAGRVRELFGNLDRYAPALLSRGVRTGRIPEAKLAALRERLRALYRSGKKPEVTILDEESMFGRARARIVVRCPELARALSLRDDRFVVEFARTPPDRNWRMRDIRPHGR